MITKNFVCRILRTEWITPTVLNVRFDPSIRFGYEAGQFLTILIPKGRGSEPDRRCYSLAVPYEEAIQCGYQILVKIIPGGVGSEFLTRLKPGDRILAEGPFGDFHYRLPLPDREVVFITTGTGIAPIRAFVGSPKFTAAMPKKATLLLGVRHETEVLFQRYFESKGVETVPCVTSPEQLVDGLWGRVTDYLERETITWNWQTTDFYIVGNERMVNEVLYYLKFRRGVPRTNIFTENFRTHLLVPPMADNVVELRRPEDGVFPELLTKKKVA
jgi:ferredoxin-NADP reductase